MLTGQAEILARTRMRMAKMGITKALVPATAADRKVDAKVLKLLGEARRAHREQGDRLDRLEELLTTGQTSVEALYSDFRRQWEVATGDTYVASPAVDRGILRQLLKQLAADEIRARMRRYFARTGWERQQGWTLAIFRKQVNGLGRASLSAQGEGRPSRDARSVAQSLEQEGWFGDRR